MTGKLGQLVYAVPEDYARNTGGWVYNERMLAELATLGWRIERQVMPAGFPFPRAAACARLADRLAALPDDRIVLVDQLSICALPDVAQEEAGRLRLAVIVHHPLALEGYRSAVDLVAAESETLECAWRVIATSEATAATLRSAYGVKNGRLAVAPPGADPLPRSTGSGGVVPTLLAVGAVVPRKGYDRLFRALAELRRMPWTLTVVGSTTRAPGHVATLRAALRRAGLEDRVSLTGALPSAEAHWRRADLYVSASRHEGYGMAVSEAVRRGLPVITTAAGGVSTWLDPCAAVLVKNDDEAGFTAALERLLGDAHARARLGAAAIKWSAGLPTWTASAHVLHRPLLDGTPVQRRPLRAAGVGGHVHAGGLRGPQ